MGKPIRYCGLRLINRQDSGINMELAALLRPVAAHDVQHEPLISRGERAPLKQPAVA